MIRAVLAPIALAAILVLGFACAHGPRARRTLTGTCDGACSHYWACKGSDDASRIQSCVSECQGVFSDPDSLRAFESLECSDAVAFIEGDSGRPPGSAGSTPAASTSAR